MICLSNFSLSCSLFGIEADYKIFLSDGNFFLSPHTSPLDVCFAILHLISYRKKDFLALEKKIKLAALPQQDY